METPFQDYNFATFPIAEQASSATAPMAGTAGYPTQTAGEQEREETVRIPQKVFLATKVHLPRSRPSYVHRPALITRLQQGLEGKLTLLSAPAGAGKTTLLANWLRMSDIPNAWLSLEAEENEPTRFFSYLIAALQTLQPELATATQELLQSTHALSTEHIMSILSNEITNSNLAPFVLVLDDYHQIHSETIHTMLAFLLKHWPPQMHLVIATRVDPPFPLTSLRARGELAELRMQDLRLDREETQTFLQTLTNLQLEHEVVTTVEDRTEGWIAGVQLAALSLRHTNNPQTFLQMFRGNHRFVFDYLSEEVLLQQPTQIQDFLLTTCILDKLQSSLCNAVTGMDNSQEMLETLERENLFLISLDAVREWYRYHPLFAETLRARLNQRDPAHQAALHSRASQWYEQQGFFVAAIQHAIKAQNLEEVMALLEKFGLDFIVVEEIPDLVLEWLQTLPFAYIEAHPQLCLLQALAYNYLNRNDLALHALEQAQAGLSLVEAEETQNLLHAHIVACQALIQFAFGELDQSIRNAQEALALLPESENTLRSHVLQCAIRGYQASGDVSLITERLAVNAVVDARLMQKPTMLLLSMSNLAWVQILRGRFHQAATTYREVGHILEDQKQKSLPVGSPNYSIGSGLLFYQWNQLDRAEEYLTQGLQHLKAFPSMSAELLTLGYLNLAHLLSAKGDYAQAIEKLDELSQISKHYPFSPLLILTGEAVHAEIELARGNLQAALQWADQEAPRPDKITDYFYERAFLTLIRIRLAQSRVNPEAVSLLEIVQNLQILLFHAEAKGRSLSVLEIRVLLALTMDLLEQEQEALETLEQILRQTEPEHMIRLLADEGLPMKQLLIKIHTPHPGKQSYLKEVIAACAPQEDTSAYAWESASATFISPSAYQLQLTPPEPLSERELEVMRLISAGASNNQIADQLVIALSTVKRHVTNIFAKLGVSSRTQAIIKAREYRLL